MNKPTITPRPTSPPESRSARGPQPDWTLLRSFVAVVETGSLTAAARRLAITQPTVGRHIRALEESVGETLFERRPEGLRPNQRASAIYERAAGLDQAVAGLVATLAAPSGGVSGIVRVTTSMTFGVEVLPDMLAELLADNPGLEIELIADDGMRNLMRREADVAVRFVRPDQASVIATRVGSVGVGLYASRSYLARFAAPPGIADLQHCDLIGMEDALSTVEAARAMGIEVDARQVRLRSDTYLAQIAAIRAGIGIGICQHWLAARLPELVPVLPGAAIPPLELWVATHDDIQRSGKVRVVFDFLVRRLRERFGAEAGLQPR